MTQGRGRSGAWRRLATFGGRAFALLLLSNLIILATAGLSWLWLLWRVWRVASTATAEARPDPWIVVFGMRLEQDRVGADYACRLERAAVLLARFPESRAVLLGGKTGDSPGSEAAAGRAYLVARGIDDSRLSLEERSRHTLENLREARQSLGAHGQGRPLLLSSRYHLARVQAIASGFGLAHRLCAAEASDLPGPRGRVLRLLGEAYYLHWFLVARLWARLTRNRRMLNEIS